MIVPFSYCNRQYFLGEVYAHSKTKCMYHIKWLDVMEPDEWISLNPKDHTLGINGSLATTDQT